MGVFGQLKTSLQYASWGIFALSLLLASLSLKTLVAGLTLFFQGSWADALAALSKFGAENVFALRLGALSLLLSWVVVPILFCVDAVLACCCCEGRAAAVAVAAPAKAVKAAPARAAPAKEAAAPAAEAAPAKATPAKATPPAKAARRRASSSAAKRQ